MSNQTDNLVSLLIPYGLTGDEARIYLDLWAHGVDSALKISRRVHTARTKVYRILDKLEKLGMVTMKLSSRGQRFEASHPKQLSFLIEEKEQEAKLLKKTLPTLKEQLKQLSHQDTRESKVLYYEGLEGLKQVTYNSLKAKGELLTMEISDMNAFFDHDFAENMRLKFIERKISTRTLTNLTKIKPWTEAAGEMVKKYWQIRKFM